MTNSLHTHTHMSPAQAAQVAGVSRWTIMRAIKAQELQAIRDNRNHWQIAPDALDKWRSSTVRTPDDLHTSEADSLRATLAAETTRADVAEALLAATQADRDRWQNMAERLADSQSRSWWPWKSRK
jgi:excisionase family DNA binding protein